MGQPRQVDHARAADTYARQVTAGKIPACNWVRLACERHLKDLEDGPARGLRYDRRAANRICRFVELLPHIKGKWARSREKVRLEPWQKFILCVIFGWMRKPEDGGRELRRFRTVYIEVPRKNGKSFLSAAVGLYMLGPDEEEGAEIVSAATTREQASIIFSAARHMALRTARYREVYGVQVLRHAIVREATASNFKALSSDTDNLDGLNVHFSPVDELHAHKSRALWDVLESATGAREQPILWAITTAGGNQDGVCYQQREYVSKILEGVLDDDSYFGIIYTVDDPAKWDDPEQWKMANPNYGVSVRTDTLEEDARKARHSAASLNNFLTKHLDVWVNAATSFMNMAEWKAGMVADLHAFAVQALADDLKHPTLPSFGIPPEFDGRECWIGADLASRVDIASLAFVFPDEDGGATVFGRHYLPSELVEEAGSSTGGHYLQWARAGWLTLSDGNTIDLDRIEADVLRAAERFKVTEFDHDPWQGQQMVAHLAEKGIVCVEVKPMVSTFSPAMKEVEALVKEGKLRHNGDPCAGWMVSNVTAKEDFKQNVFPRKEKPGRKIDFFTALLEAMNRFVGVLVSDDSCYGDADHEGGLLVL
jgi:phage terminase large subunit-like protein